jgi:hypothetical protein
MDGLLIGCLAQDLRCRLLRLVPLLGKLYKELVKIAHFLRLENWGYNEN